MREEVDVPTSLRVSDVHKTFETEMRPVEVLRGVFLQADGGEALAITGPSGSGKSTLLHLIGALDKPTRGRIEIDGREIYRLPERDLARFRNSAIGFVFQDHHLLPQYSVLENVIIPSLAFPDSKNGADSRARELLDRVALADRLDHRPAELSGGERQRVAVARALINRPSLLLCDEPTGSLDAENAQSVARLLFDLHRETATILIAVTHSEDLASRFARRLELREGRCSER
jgi:lipoprotein-releasing system ATP-binding protein